MACRGCYVSLDADQVQRLLSIQGERNRANYLDELIGEFIRGREAGKELWLNLDKSWFMLQRSLANYPPNEEWLTGELTERHGTYPLKLIISGGRFLGDEGDWIICLIEPGQVTDLAAALQKIDQKEFASRYWKSASESFYPEFGEEDLEYTWAYFTEARDFLARIAGTGRSVVFLADQ